jgi:transposase
MPLLDRDLATADTPADCMPSCQYCRARQGAVPAADERDVPDADKLAHLYLCRGLSTYAIGEITGLSRQRVTRMLRRAGVPLRPRGAGRLRPLRRDDPPGLRQVMVGLYQAGRLSSPQIAAIVAMPERTVRDRLRRYGIQARTRGRWNREDRQIVPAELLDDLYTRLGMTADEVGRRLGTSRGIVLRSAHDAGIPVRAGGAVPVQGPEEIELIDALYADPLIAAVLDTRGIPRMPPGAPGWERFPVPVPLTTALVKDLYWGCGTALSHIELLTGQPAMTIRGFMHRAGIPLRHPGGRTPFLRRWRQSRQAGEPSHASPRTRAGRTRDAHRSRAGHHGRPEMEEE